MSSNPFTVKELILEVVGIGCDCRAVIGLLKKKKKTTDKWNFGWKIL